jgi:hypothetical protein
MYGPTAKRCRAGWLRMFKSVPSRCARAYFVGAVLCIRAGLGTNTAHAGLSVSGKSHALPASQAPGPGVPRVEPRGAALMRTRAFVARARLAYACALCRALESRPCCSSSRLCGHASAIQPSWPAPLMRACDIVRQAMRLAGHCTLLLRKTCARLRCDCPRLAL